MSIEESKRTLRRAMRDMLMRMPPAERARRSLRLRRLLAECMRPKIFAFFPMAGEPDLLGAIPRGARLFLPVVKADADPPHIDFHPVECAHLEALPIGRFGIPEPPINGPPALPAADDLLLLPGLAFTNSGERLGRGGGFFDRFLGSLPLSCRPFVLGVCFEPQVLASIPTAPHDARADRVLAG